jgi:hypothetical protein
MNSKFSYLAEKVKSTEFSTQPFQHVYIESFLNDDDFNALLGLSEITLQSKTFSSDEELLNSLKEEGYAPIDFPGCFLEEKKYLKWKNGRKRSNYVSTSCEGAGMTFRLKMKRDNLLKELSRYLGGEEFNRVIAEKFNINYDDCLVDHGIHKYLDGYEISPHPDIRSKAATYMLNINPHPNSEEMSHHTHYLEFKGMYKYVQSLWENCLEINRGWVPWKWCESIFQQTKNNSIVIFSPSNDTLHAVKADYNHLESQRTQAYGNLWYKDAPALLMAKWEDIDIPGGKALEAQKRNIRIRKSLFNNIPAGVKNTLKVTLKSRFLSKKPKDNLK